MDVQKPKWAHGWRGFLKEYAIVVIGVLTALAAGQAVEAMNWADRTRKTEANLRAELSQATLMAQVHIAQQKCEYEMLAKLRDALLQAGDDWRPPYTVVRPDGVTMGVFAAPIATWQTQGWKNAQADGTANHLGHDLQMRFGSAYEKIAEAKAANEAQHAATSELNSLAWPRRLDPQSRTDYLRLLSQLNESVRYMATDARQILGQTAELGVKPLDLETYGPSLQVYRGICDEFRAGKTTIVVTVPPGGA
jgi:type II secretory pathway pseudopilin PulG